MDSRNLIVNSRVQRYGHDEKRGGRCGDLSRRSTSLVLGTIGHFRR